MSKVVEFLNGKKTYIVVLATILTAGAQALGYSIPEWVYAVEGAIGIGAIRIGITNSQS